MVVTIRSECLYNDGTQINDEFDTPVEPGLENNDENEVREKDRWLGQILSSKIVKHTTRIIDSKLESNTLGKRKRSLVIIARAADVAQML